MNNITNFSYGEGKRKQILKSFGFDEDAIQKSIVKKSDDEEDDDDDDDMEKANGGEGSRGGKVIGHTKSGKPIYENKLGSHESYKNYSYQDHADAASAHAKKIEPDTHSNTGMQTAAMHNKIVNSHKEQMSKKSSTREYNDINSKVDHEQEAKNILAKKKRGAALSDSDIEEHTGKKDLSEGDKDLIRIHAFKQKGTKKEELKKWSKQLVDKVYADKKTEKSIDEDNDIEKGEGGEGSKGGIVIGHTVSGKPIYQKSNESNTKNYTSMDHHNAYAAHKDQMDKQEKFVDGAKNKTYEHHAKMAMFHKQQAARTAVDEREKSFDNDIEKAFDFIMENEDVVEKAFDDLMKAEGSRGGKVIGHTKSGKAIYDSFSHPSHKEFTGEDHTDAADLHDKLHKKESAKRKRDASEGRTTSSASHSLNMIEHERQEKYHKEAAKKLNL